MKEVNKVKTEKMYKTKWKSMNLVNESIKVIVMGIA